MWLWLSFVTVSFVVGGFVVVVELCVVVCGWVGGWGGRLFLSLSLFWEGGGRLFSLSSFSSSAWEKNCVWQTNHCHRPDYRLQLLSFTTTTRESLFSRCQAGARRVSLTVKSITSSFNAGTGSSWRRKGPAKHRQHLLIDFSNRRSLFFAMHCSRTRIARGNGELPGTGVIFYPRESPELSWHYLPRKA